MINIIKSDLYKYRKTMIYPIHILCPLLAALILGFYFKNSNWSMMNKLDIFINSIGMVFPVVISVLISMAISIEESGEFKNLLSSPYGKKKMILSKFLIFFIMGIISGQILVNIFYFIEGKNIIDNYLFFIVLVLILCISSIFNYIFHIFLNLNFGKNISMAISVCQLLIAALFRTGLGDNIWQFSPSSWGMRISYYWVFNSIGEKNISLDFKNIIIILGILILEIILFNIWYIKFEGREITE